MSINYQIRQLTREHFPEAIDLVLRSELDTREEIEHHLEHLDAHFIALKDDRIIGVIGWYQDNVNWATEAMGDKFPGEEAYWVGFFTVDQEFRGKGVGFGLLKKLEEIIKARGVEKLWVSSVSQTRFYYQRQGFKLVMQGKINGKPKFFMVKDLK